MLWPVDGHFEQARRFDAQIAAKKPLQKPLRATIAKGKLTQQAGLLRDAGLPDALVKGLMPRIKYGDPTNIGAQAARRYRTALSGPGFRWDRSAGGKNSLLNCGFTVFRPAIARAVVAAGLYPTLSINQSNQGNPMRLADDLLGPFRPIVNRTVWMLSRSGVEVPSRVPNFLQRAVERYCELVIDLLETA